MSRNRPKNSSFIPLLILVVAVALWGFDAYRQGGIGNSSSQKQPHAREAEVSASSTRTGSYETYTGCTLAPDKTNDGDSFRVKLPGGRTEIIRLYFVDCPESSFKSYGGGRNNHARIADQARDMGGISSTQAVEIGKKAKDFSLTHLGKAPFTLHTKWDNPFKDKRYSGFIVLSYNNKPRFLHELLIEKGYARVHTKGAQLPDGTAERKQEDHLYDLQRIVKQKERGL